MTARGSVNESEGMPDELREFRSSDWAGSRTEMCGCGPVCTAPQMCELAAWYRGRLRWLRAHGGDTLGEFRRYSDAMDRLRGQVESSLQTP
jgi:hypothetical protein